MANKHFRALKAKYRGDESPRVFCDGIIPSTRVAYLLKPGTTVGGFIKNSDVALIATALGCGDDEVMEALAKDAGEPWARLAVFDNQGQRDAFLAVRALDARHHEVLAAMGPEQVRALLDAVSRLSPDQVDALVRLTEQVGALLDSAQRMTPRQLRAVLTFMHELVAPAEMDEQAAAV